MNSAERQALAERVLGFSDADETEISVYDEDNRLTRFTHNAIHQNIAVQNTTVKVRTIIDGRSGVIDTNDLEEEALRKAVAAAIDIAKHAPRDDEFPGLPTGTPAATPPGAFVPQTADASAELRANVAAEIFATAEAQKFWAAGYVTTSRTGVTILNSKGTRASFDGTDSGVNVKQNAEDSTGFAERYGTDVAVLSGKAVGGVAADKALKSRHPVAVEPGPWTVILEPAAFGELLSYLTGHFSAQSFDEGSSFLSDGLDKKYVGTNVTISDDYAHPLNVGQPFDYEGFPTQRLALIENGIAKNVVTDSYYAAKLGRPNTGHALPAPNSYGPHPMHIVLAPGTKSEEQLIAETERGLLVSRFWYIRPVDHRLTIVTGMTRDGVFLIENGKITTGVRNMRFNESIIGALGAAEFSSEQARTGGYSYSSVVPTAKIEGFRFTSGTDF